MNGLGKKLGLGIVLAATTLTAAVPADAQRWRGRGDWGYRGHRGGNVAAGALLDGIVGLGVGAAIASNNRNRYYDRGYYYDAPPRVVYRERYYAPPPPPVVVRERYYGGGYGYGDGYYGGGYGGGYYGW